MRRKGLEGGEASTRPWWRGAVFYEIYIRSFADSNRDGIGDLPGITSKLEYLKELGVDAIWITPFYPSPQKDHGYDVADYYGVNPEYGTMADFSRLVKGAHDLGLKLLVDLVPNHTSDQHPWFKAAVATPKNAYRKRYYFADAKPDGSPPNNWESAFGGPAWTKDKRSGQWYMHLFAPEQPDLNWWNPAVPKEFERIVKFWLDKGADGYRIDVASALFKRKDLGDQPMVKDPITGKTRLDSDFAIDQPQVHAVYRRWREIVNGYRPERVLVGEIFDAQRQSRYLLPDQLDMAFALIRARWDAPAWKQAIDIDRRALRGARRSPSWTLSNHDVVRHVTRFGGGSRGRARARAALLMLLGLPGQVFLYQGEELGLEQVIVPEKKRQDPFFIHSHGKQVGRDGCRVPMPWQRGRPHAGFSVKAPWLPMPAGWDRLAVDAQLASAGSMLGFYRSVLAFRRTLGGVLDADMRWSPAPAGVLAYQRGRLKVAVNFLARPVEIPARGSLLIASQPRVLLKSGKLILPANSGAWIDTEGGR